MWLFVCSIYNLYEWKLLKSIRVDCSRQNTYGSTLGRASMKQTWFWPKNLWISSFKDIFCQFVSSIFFVWVQSRNINIFWHSPWLIDRSNITDVLLHVLRRRINIPATFRQDFFFGLIYFLGGTVGFVIHVSLISVVITVEERRNRPFCSAWSLPLTITLERP
jgi:hypothetical protein